MIKEQHILYKKYENDPIQFITDYRIGFHSQDKEIKLLPLLEFEKAILEKINDYKFSIFLKSRQMHLSSLTTAYLAWAIIFNPGIRIAFISPSLNESTRHLLKIKTVLNNYYGEEHEKEYVQNNRQLISLINGSQVSVYSSNPYAGIWQVIDILVFDEMDFMENAEEMWMNLGIAVSANKNSKIISYSTLNKKPDSFFCKLLRESLNNQNDFKAMKVIWSMNPYYDNTWYENYCKIFNYDKYAISKELDCRFLEDEKKEKKKNKIIPFRVDKFMMERMNKKIEKKILETDINYTVTDYIRELVEKDLNS